MQVLWYSFIVCSSLALDLAASLPSTPLPTTPPHSDPVETTVNSSVPLEFPKYSQNYTFVDNSSIRENLANHSKNDTEVDDLLGLDVTENSETPTVIFPVEVNPSEENEDIKSKNDTEWIENGDDTEDQRVETEVILEVTNKTEPSYEKSGLFDGHIAAIVAVTFLILSIFAYVGLLMWRRFLETKYGSREMLVNEDDFVIDPDNLKYFSI